MVRCTTVVRGAQELKVKESNRVESVADLVRAVGGRIQVTDDGWEIRGAGELRVKESDRIATVVSALRAVGAHVKALDDGFEVTGVPHRLRGGRIDAAGDHRIAMLGAVAGVCSQQGVTVEGAEALAVSFPDFAERLASVSA